MQALAEVLGAYRGFAECILLEVRLGRYQTVLELLFDYVWDERGAIRTDVGRRLDPVRVRFGLVTAAQFDNGLTPGQLAHPELMNWGANEVAGVQVTEEVERIPLPSGGELALHEGTVNWEPTPIGRRRIVVRFAHLAIERVSGSLSPTVDEYLTTGGAPSN